MSKILFAAKSIEYEGIYGTAPHKYEIRVKDIESIALKTREKKVLFGLIKKQERYMELTHKGIMGLENPLIYAEGEEGKDEYNDNVEKLKQFCGNNEIPLTK